MSLRSIVLCTSYHLIKQAGSINRISQDNRSDRAVFAGVGVQLKAPCSLFYYPVRLFCLGRHVPINGQADEPWEGLGVGLY